MEIPVVKMAVFREIRLTRFKHNGTSFTVEKVIPYFQAILYISSLSNWTKLLSEWLFEELTNQHLTPEFIQSNTHSLRQRFYGNATTPSFPQTLHFLYTQGPSYAIFVEVTLILPCYLQYREIYVILLRPTISNIYNFTKYLVSCFVKVCKFTLSISHAITSKKHFKLTKY
jgi:hypothetical protein